MEVEGIVNIKLMTLRKRKGVVEPFQGLGWRQEFSPDYSMRNKVNKVGFRGGLFYTKVNKVGRYAVLQLSEIQPRIK
jgi:hypothetical protein